MCEFKSPESGLHWVVRSGMAVDITSRYAQLDRVYAVKTEMWVGSWGLPEPEERTKKEEPVNET